MQVSLTFLVYQTKTHTGKVTKVSKNCKKHDFIFQNRRNLDSMETEKLWKEEKKKCLKPFHKVREQIIAQMRREKHFLFSKNSPTTGTTAYEFISGGQSQSQVWKPCGKAKLFPCTHTSISPWEGKQQHISLRCDPSLFSSLMAVIIGSTITRTPFAILSVFYLHARLVLNSYFTMIIFHFP